MVRFGGDKPNHKKSLLLHRSLDSTDRHVWSARPRTEDLSTEGTLRSFIEAFDNLDWERFGDFFADDATVFYPRGIASRTRRRNLSRAKHQQQCMQQGHKAAHFSFVEAFHLTNSPIPSTAFADAWIQIDRTENPRFYVNLRVSRFSSTEPLHHSPAFSSESNLVSYSILGRGFVLHPSRLSEKNGNMPIDELWGSWGRLAGLRRIDERGFRSEPC